ncbi:unnamed protein product [Closterium sp. NIES-53]
MAGLIGIARDTVATPEEHYPNLRAEFHAVELLTFTVISRCYSPGVQIALKSCTEYLDAGHRAWHFIESTYQLEEQLSHIWMREEETATDYCNRAWRILATMRMASVHYSTASYLTHVLLPRTSCRMRRCRKLSGPRSSLHSGRGGGSRRRDCWLCGDLDHLSFECPDRSDFDDDDAKGGRGRFGSHRPRRGRNQPRKEKQLTKSSASAKNADSSASGKGQDDKEASCSLVGVMEPTVSLAPEVGEDIQAMAAAVQENPAVVLLNSGPRHCRSARGGREAGAHLRRALCPGVRANLLSAGQLMENGVKEQEEGDGMLLVSAAGGILGRSSYTGRLLCTDLRPCSAKSTTPTTEVVALQAIISVTKLTLDRLHARLSHVGMNTIRSLAKHEVATGLDLKSSSGADLPCVSCVGRKLARHTFPDQGSNADDVLALVHVWVRPVAKKSDALQEFVQWLAVTERQTKKSVLMLRSDWGWEALDGVLLGNGWKKIQVNMAIYFKVGDDKVTYWVLVYVDDLLAASSSAAMLKELKEQLKAAFELREISPMQKYLGLKIVRDRSVRKLWLHQQGYADKLRRRFLYEEQNGCTPKTPILVDAYATLTFDDEEAQVRQEEEYWQKFGLLQFAATTTRPYIAFACSKLGSSLTVRSDQHWREVDRCLAYLANTRNTALKFGGGAELLKLVGYVDADDAGNKQNRTSTGGYV